MTLADRIAAVLLEQGPLPGCVIATTVKKQKAEVIASLHGNPDRFVKTGKARASRWDVRSSFIEGFDAQAAAAHFGHWDCRPDDPPCSVELATKFLGWFEQVGYVERVNGNGRFRVTEAGLDMSWLVNQARP